MTFDWPTYLHFNEVLVYLAAIRLANAFPDMNLLEEEENIYSQSLVLRRCIPH